MTYSDPVDRSGAVIEGLRGGLGFALPCSLVPLVVHLLDGPQSIEPWSPWALAAAFIVSGAVGGVVYGLLDSWRSSLAGRFARGVLIALAVMVCSLVFMGERPSWTRADLKAVTAFALIGGAIDVVKGGRRRQDR
jgi:MFS family permease